MPRYKIPNAEVFDAISEWFDPIEDSAGSVRPGIQSIRARFENAEVQGSGFPRVIKINPDAVETLEFIIEQVEEENEDLGDRLGIEVLP